MPISKKALVKTEVSAFSRRLTDVRLALQGGSLAKARLEMPLEMLGIFVRGYEDGAPIKDLAIYVIAEMGFAHHRGVEAVSPQGLPRMSIPLGLLGTDHVGYCSFDLRPLGTAEVVDALVSAWERRFGALPEPKEPADQLVLTLTRLSALPFADMALREEVLDKGEFAPDFAVLRIELSEADMRGRERGPPLPSMQSASIRDWRLSPGSFSFVGGTVVGEGGCETFLPTNLATQLFNFRQVMRLAPTPGGKPHLMVKTERASLGLRAGLLLDYSTEWFPIGHALGRVAYSLPLAPAEKVKIAVVDWSRQDRAKRSEDTALNEAIKHDWNRDRTVSETVSASVHESQSGSSFMAGLGASAAVPLGALSMGASLALGGSTSSTEGSRDASGQMLQRLSDGFHQASSAMRELQSTVVIQTEQSEKSNVQTRTVVNYNHSHALTILYYEVLRHYRVVTRLTRRRPALLVDFSSQLLPLAGAQEGTPPEIPSVESVDTILQHRPVIEAVLLDPAVRPGFDAMQRYACMRLNFRDSIWPGPDQDRLVDEMTLRVVTGATGPSHWVWARLVPKEGDAIHCKVLWWQKDQFNQWQDPLKNHLHEPGSGRVPVPGFTQFRLLPEAPVRWGNVARLELHHSSPPNSSTTAQPTPWVIETIELYTGQVPVYWTMFGPAPSPLKDFQVNSVLPLPIAPYVKPPVSAWDQLSDDERCAIRRLRDHVWQHVNHYSQAVWLAEEPAKRAARFDAVQLSGGLSLLDVVENEPVDAMGTWVAFPIAAGFAEHVVSSEVLENGIADGTEEFLEQIISLPTRGVFAEAKLGHCNASEVIDTTRFWDWQLSPIPDDAPAITGADAGSRDNAKTDGLTPSAFPAPLVNVVSPSSAPDPTGLGAAIGLLGSLGGFRDQSGQKEVAGLLGTLSNNASGLANEGLKVMQQREQAKRAQEAIDIVRNTKELPEAERGKLIGQIAAGMAGNVVQQGQQQSQQQGQNSSQNSTQNANQGVAQGQSNTQSQSGGSQTAAQALGSSQNVSVGGSTQPKPTSKPTLPERPPQTGKIFLQIALNKFGPVGQISAVWGGVIADGRTTPIKQIPATYLLKVELENAQEGTIELYVQLDNGARTPSGSHVLHFGGKSLNLTVEPEVLYEDVEAETLLAATATIEAKYHQKASGKLPIKLFPVEIESGLDTGGKLQGEAKKTEKKKYKVAVYTGNLTFSP